MMSVSVAHPLLSMYQNFKQLSYKKECKLAIKLGKIPNYFGKFLKLFRHIKVVFHLFHSLIYVSDLSQFLWTNSFLNYPWSWVYLFIPWCSLNHCQNSIWAEKSHEPQHNRLPQYQSVYYIDREHFHCPVLCESWAAVINVKFPVIFRMWLSIERKESVLYSLVVVSCCLKILATELITTLRTDGP